MVSDNEERDSLANRLGQCANCRFMREQPTLRGATFFRCARADEDPTFIRYPAIPVRDCPGFESPDSGEVGARGRDHTRDKTRGME